MSKTHIYKDNLAVAEAFARYLYRQISITDTFHIALSGGSTPKILFDYITKHYAQKINWQKVHLYWGDERCVPPAHADSNYGMTELKLLRHISIPFVNVHRVLGRRDPEEEAIRYGQEIEWQLPLKNGLPIFDMVLLGMGTDGHTASIFPHQMELLTSDKTCAVAVHPETGQRRITLTGEVINNARKVHLIVTGASKAKVVKEIFGKTGDYEKYPAFYIDRAEWWMDKAAAGEE